MGSLGASKREGTQGLEGGLRSSRGDTLLCIIFREPGLVSDGSDKFARAAQTDNESMRQIRGVFKLGVRHALFPLKLSKERSSARRSVTYQQRNPPLAPD